MFKKASSRRLLKKYSYSFKLHGNKNTKWFLESHYTNLNKMSLDIDTELLKKKKQEIKDNLFTRGLFGFTFVASIRVDDQTVK